MNYKRKVKAIHTNTVAAALAKREPNYALGVPSRDGHPTDGTLPRAICTTMRLGHCSAFQTYKHKLNSAVDVLSWVSCVPSLSCPAAPTLLQPIDMWFWPGKAAEFFVSLPPFCHLPPLAVPRPPPEPPPPGGRGL
jgi:hypothetical protein